MVFLFTWPAPAQPGLPQEITVENQPGGRITAYFRKEGAGSEIGRVISALEGPLTRVTIPGFTAANLAKDSSVTATAANGIHIRVRGDNGMALLFSFLPREFSRINKGKYASYQGAAVVTDIRGGQGLFGKECAPYLGNEVLVKRVGSEWLRLDDKSLADYQPRHGDVWSIRVQGPHKPAASIRIENRVNGELRVDFKDGSSAVLARVVKPVGGVGGFTGASLGAFGQIRAHHPGVFEIITSRKFSKVDGELKPPPDEGAASAFQIIPFEHTLDGAGLEDGFQGEGFFGYSRVNPVYLLVEAPEYQLEVWDRLPAGSPPVRLRRELVRALRKNPRLDPELAKKFDSIPQLQRILDGYRGIRDYFEIVDRDGSVVFARLPGPAPSSPEAIYGKGYLFGQGWLRPGEGALKVRLEGSGEWITPPDLSKGKDLTALARWEEIRLDLD